MLPALVDLRVLEQGGLPELRRSTTFSCRERVYKESSHTDSLGLWLELAEVGEIGPEAVVVPVIMDLPPNAHLAYMN